LNEIFNIVRTCIATMTFCSILYLLCFVGAIFVMVLGMFNLANTQNALLQWILEGGIPVTMMLVFLMLLVFHQLSKSPRRNQIMPMAVLVYVYVVLGTVETTFNLNVILWLAIIFMQITAKQPRTIPAEE